jgi:large conductance mechanosensitive channel
MINGFKQFLLRGNVIDLAVAVVIGAAFTSVVTSLVKDLITPLIAAIGGKPNFENLQFSIHHSMFMYGDFLNSVISFIIVAAVVYFFIVTPINTLISRAKRQKPIDPNTKKCPFCMSEIPIDAVKCAFCTSDLPKKVKKR